MASEKITLDEIETQAMFIRKAIGRKGAKSLIKSSESYQSFKVGQRNAKERESISKRRIAEATPGTDEARRKLNRRKENKMRYAESYIKKQKEMKNTTKEEIKFLKNLVSERGYRPSDFRKMKDTREIIVKEFEKTFLTGKFAVFKRVKGEYVRSGKDMVTLQSKLDSLYELMENDPNIIRNYARFEENFFNKVLPALYKDISEGRGDESKATVEEMNQALDKAILEFQRIQQGRTRKGRTRTKIKRTK